MIGTHRDISEQKNIEENLIDVIEEVEQQSEAKASFLAHMSHEIRTPLTAITGIAEILQKQSPDFNEKQKKLIQTLSTSSQSLKELINDILDFSKIEKGEVHIEEAFFPVQEVVAEIISIMSVQAHEKNIGFKVIDDDIQNLEYCGDKARIRQILLNLVGNAIKFTDTGQVTLLIEKNTDSDAENLNFIVQDTGIGINDDVLKTIFDEFQQADRSVSRQYGGTGLGLPISNKLAALMGGAISVKSKKNIGSTFTFTLPLKGKSKDILGNDNQPSHIKIAERLSSAIRQEQCVLIADDYEGNIIILTYLMDDIGLQYDIARNGEDAVNQWKSKHYDLILMDVQMPVMDGLTATQTIRKCEEENKFDTIPIIGMTAHALVEDRQKCIDSGMTDYLSKPIDSQQLKEKIYYHLYDSSRRQATA
jgi:CheY-like chemotaxis protein/nitrogen-specific signal transduction histidine kinase